MSRTFSYDSSRGVTYFKFNSGISVAFGQGKFDAGNLGLGRKTIELEMPSGIFSAQPKVFVEWCDTPSAMDYVENLYTGSSTTTTKLLIYATIIEAQYVWYFSYFAIGKWK